MVMRIKQLPPFVANQIAAGEVIERPASVVKELLENALDAEASTIVVEIEHGGLNNIKISDNGHGIHAQDLPLAIAAQATSKISQLEDLYALDSMGFRGEALASMASISKLSLCTKTEEAEHALLLTAIGNDVTITPAARSKGTTVTVNDLFFNAPVRKKFLKSERLEFLAVETVVKRFALSAPNLSITLKHNGKLVCELPPVVNETSQLQRLSKIFGPSFVKDARFLEVKQDNMQLSGWLSGREFQRSQNDRQWVYINQRMIKDKLLLHAIKQAYEGFLHPGRFPACLLYLTINKDLVDVNVHPTKQEVRFHEPRAVHDFCMQFLKEALQEEASKPVNLSRPRVHPMTISKPLVSDVNWVILNTRFGLIFKEEKPYLVDIQGLYQSQFLETLKDKTNLDATRPLLVPIRYPLDNQTTAKQLVNVLEKWGIGAIVTSQGLEIKRIPLIFAQLDVKVLVQKLIEEHGFEDENMLKLLCECQFFDAFQLTPEEREEFGFLLDLKSTASFMKQVTLEDCRTMLYA
jgi:DNA mismatch repair protein MutL